MGSSVDTRPDEQESQQEESGDYLQDTYGRPMKSLRISITDRCNFACTYCMPDGGPDNLSPKEDILSYEELARLTRVFVDMGVDNVRVTGGEPLLRQDIPVLIDYLNGIDGLNDIAMTTNGMLLRRYIDELIEAGLHRINFSLDTFRKDRFRELTQRKHGLDQVLDGLDALLERPELHPVKLNVVAIRDFNEDELIDFVDWAVVHGQAVRFIEFMPLEHGDHWSPERLLPEAEMKEIITEEYELEPLDKKQQEEIHQDEHAPATTFQVAGTEGQVGFIPSVTRPFCHTCDRIRLTADGNIKNCLFSYEEDDIRTALRDGADTRELKNIIRTNYKNKWEGGCVKLKKGEYDPQKQSRSMSRIGG